MFDARSLPQSLSSLKVVRGQALPVEEMVLGRPLTEAADLLPRLFNLCRAAQALAVRRALGLAEDPAAAVTLRHEVLRDHLLKLLVAWPQLLGKGSTALPEGWATDAHAVRRAVFGHAATPPATVAAFRAFMGSGEGAGPVLRAIDQCFPKGAASIEKLEPVGRSNAFTLDPVENSVAQRHALHPALRYIVRTRGRGPLWRAAARLYDIEACLIDRLPVPVELSPGRVMVAATRGTYAVEAASEGGRVTAFRRVTPTDHMLAEGGILAQSLARLPADRTGLAPLLLDILDPCSPVRLSEDTPAEGPGDA